MFRKVLIANRGEIAARVARTCKRMGVTSVAIHGEAEQDDLHVQACDEALPLVLDTRDMQACAEQLVEAARRVGAEAVHPGYGRLAESPELARAVQAAGLLLVGATPEVLETCRDRAAIRKLAHFCGVRTVPGGELPDDADATLALLEELGYPLVVKAVANGVGVGMQVAEEAEELAACLEACRERALRAGVPPRLYLEGHLERPRHVEVQVVGDAAGELVAIGERECSVRKRQQKLLEESPAPALAALSQGESLREALCDSALRIARELKFVGTGSAEFLLDADGRSYFGVFHPRLQVGHDVTEMCTGVDLVELQLRIAAGEPLPDEAQRATSSGHAMAARIYVEHGERRGQGEVRELRWPNVSTGKLRIESSVQPGSVLAPREGAAPYDSMIAKVIAYGPSRVRTLLTLDRALAETTLEPLPTNMRSLRRLLNDESFRAGQYDVSFADRTL